MSTTTAPPTSSVRVDTARPTDDPVGLVGTGLMGAPMALRFLAAGHPTFVCNRTRQKAERLAAAGVIVLDEPSDIGAAVATVVLALPSGRIASKASGSATSPPPAR